jgi:hypothetical protein
MYIFGKLLRASLLVYSPNDAILQLTSQQLKEEIKNNYMASADSKLISGDILKILKERTEEIWSLADQFPLYDKARIILFENKFYTDFLSVLKKYLNSSHFWNDVVKLMQDSTLYFSNNQKHGDYYEFYNNLFLDVQENLLFFTLIQQSSIFSSIALFFCIYIVKTNFFQPSLNDIVKLNLYVTLKYLFVKQIFYYNRQEFKPLQYILNTKYLFLKK